MGDYEKLKYEALAAELAFLQQAPPALDADIIRDMVVRIDSDGDFAIFFETHERRYAIVVVVKDNRDIGWKECVAMRDALQVSQLGSQMNNEIMVAIGEKLDQKYGCAKLSAQNNRLVCVIQPSRGELPANTPADCIRTLAFVVDKDNDFCLSAVTGEGHRLTCVMIANFKTPGKLCLKGAEMMKDLFSLVEPGDKADRTYYLKVVGLLRAKYNDVIFKPNSNPSSPGTVSEILVQIRPTRVENPAPMDSMLVAALAANPDRGGQGSVASGGGNTAQAYPGVTLTKLLKDSGQAKVYTGTFQGKQVAVKIFKDTGDVSHADFKTELRMLLKLGSHRNVISVLDFFESPQPAVIMTLVNGVDLRDKLDRDGRYSNTEAQKIAIGIAEGLAYLHKNGVVHRDVKSPNVLIEQNSGRPIVIDLGLGKGIDGNASAVSRATVAGITTALSTATINTKTDGIKGSLLWMAPEMIVDQKWSDRSDVYAFGTILWELLSGKTPWVDEIRTERELLLRVARGDTPSMRNVQHASSELKSIIQKCWTTNPRKRPSMHTVLDLLYGNDSERLFRSVDKDNSGSLDFGEFAVFLQKYAGDKVAAKDYYDVFSAVDTDGGGTVELSEFLTFWNRVQTLGLQGAVNRCKRDAAAAKGGKYAFAGT
ncbi:putative serine/threonine-protein kinase [Porphyridium purpureum]|uniref:Putative serine/threonine-protein kinase n=1 Tax=Porphyridium purpureum TaxID=35688 RepID=A0A5J4YNA9_PORPP|nr:putative serine/threonine-protein kinase [Porphyridium purpureum]|eukprot:POR2843..scf222_8